MSALAALAVAALGALGLAPTADAQDWPGFRGADGGRAAGTFRLPADCSLEDARWRVRLPGPGHSSPVVQADSVFVTCASADGDARLLLCLAAGDGALRWQRAVPFEPYRTHERLNGFVSATPAVDAERVYVAWADGERLVTHAFGLDGSPAWEADIGPRDAQHGAGASPLLAGGLLIVTNDHEGEAPSALVGLDPATGEEVWRRERKSVRAAYGTPLARSAADGSRELVFASTAHGLTALDAATGALRWEVPDVFTERVVATPALAGGLVLAFAGKGGGGTEGVAIALPGEPDAGQVRYRLRRNLPYVPSPVVAGQRAWLFSDGGIVSAIDVASGKALYRERVDGEFFGSPILADGRLYALTKAGELLILGTSGEFELLARVPLGERSFATPALAGGVLYLRTEQHLAAFANVPPEGEH